MFVRGSGNTSTTEDLKFEWRRKFFTGGFLIAKGVSYCVAALQGIYSIFRQWVFHAREVLVLFHDGVRGIDKMARAETNGE